MINLMDLTFVVDVDIKGFFDNVNHTKHIQQMWELGIRDKNLLCIIRKILKAPVVRHYFTDPMIDDRMAEYYLTENPMVVDSYWA